jgi:hypothetical protein
VSGANDETLGAAEILREMRSSLASLRAAAETLDGFPQVEPNLRASLLRVVLEESERLGERMHRLESTWRSEHAPAATRVRLADVLEDLRAGLAALGLRCALEAPAAELVDAELTLPVGVLRREVEAFFAALRRGSRVGACSLRARREDHHVRLDLGWSPEPDDLGWLLSWQGEALGAGPPGMPAGGLRAVARALDGAAWLTLDRDGGSACVRLLLPRAAA